MPLDRRQHMGTNGEHDGIIRPIGLGHEMVQRLVRRPYSFRLDTCRHRFDAFPIARKQQARAIGSERRDPISMAKNHGDGINVGGEPRLTALCFGFETHNGCVPGSGVGAVDNWPAAATATSLA